MTTLSVRSTPSHFTDEQAEEVRAELNSILSSDHFAGSKRCSDFLEFIVLRALDGDIERLTERFLGRELFGRPVDYETGTDAIVRVRANDVRRRLAEYYSEPHSNSSVKISLTSGRYVPGFDWYGAESPETVEPVLHEPSSKLPEVNAKATQPPAIADRAAARRWTTGKRILWAAVGAAVLLIAVVAWRQRYLNTAPQSAVDDFWSPLLRDQRSVVICSGGVIFAKDGFADVVTASKYTPYPFVSEQDAVAISQVSALLGHTGTQMQLESGVSAPLTDLREHPVILIGGYNNQWTLRLMQPLRFRFSPLPAKTIVDQAHPAAVWQRDRSIPYESADDYALVARFRDEATGSWVIVLAGLGRNGTEAAAQFATSPHYMQLLRNQLGRDFSNRTIEVILKVSVVDGKTGAPTILAVEG